MKYEAKDGGSHTAVSVAAGYPWRDIPRELALDDNDAQEACENNGADYQLIGNHHWQAIARNIESVSLNFDTTGAEIDHTFNFGHVDSGPNFELAADSDDDNGCFDITSNGDPSDDCGGGWHINKRTHILNNGEIIWDFSGNLCEWVRDNNSTSQGVDGFIQSSSYTDALKWGPSLDYSAQSGTNNGGLGKGLIDSSAGTVLRGGARNNGSDAGIFSTVLSIGPTVDNSIFGFRCVYAP